MESPETGAQQAAAGDTAASAAQQTAAQGTQAEAAQPAAVMGQDAVATAPQMTAQTVSTTVPTAAQTTTGQMMAPPAQAPAPLYPQYLAQEPLATPLTDAINAGAMGMVIVGTGTLGANLHKVNDNEMSVKEAVVDSVGKGAMGAVAAAGATYTASSLTAGGLFGLAVTIAAGTGISYLLNK